MKLFKTVMLEVKLCWVVPMAGQKKFKVMDIFLLIQHLMNLRTGLKFYSDIVTEVYTRATENLPSYLEDKNYTLEVE